MRENVALQCVDCKQRNYVTTKNKKTTWPTQKEVRNTTIVVIVFVMVCAAYLFVVDMALQSGMEKLFKAFGR